MNSTSSLDSFSKATLTLKLQAGEFENAMEGLEKLVSQKMDRLEDRIGDCNGKITQIARTAASLSRRGEDSSLSRSSLGPRIMSQNHSNSSLSVSSRLGQS